MRHVGAKGPRLDESIDVGLLLGGEDHAFVQPELIEEVILEDFGAFGQGEYEPLILTETSTKGHQCIWSSFAAIRRPPDPYLSLPMLLTPCLLRQLLHALSPSYARRVDHPPLVVAVIVAVVLMAAVLTQQVLRPMVGDLWIRELMHLLSLPESDQVGIEPCFISRQPILKPFTNPRRLIQVRATLRVVEDWVVAYLIADAGLVQPIQLSVIITEAVAEHEILEWLDPIEASIELVFFEWTHVVLVIELLHGI